MTLQTEYITAKIAFIEHLDRIARQITCEDKKQFALAVRLAQEAGATQVELAKAIGAERVNITRWSNGQATPTGPARRTVLSIIVQEINGRLEALRQNNGPTADANATLPALRGSRRLPFAQTKL